MSELFTREDVRSRVLAAADLIDGEDSLPRSLPQEDLVNLMVNAIITKLDNPEADFATVLEENYGVRRWKDVHGADE
ncbi:hypothetical protein ACFQ1S_29725 [Kibdelosporangium lantanae]|uniref:Uncharacterized protein n=1 Tax=Kibdelosporangium lantanae TaxID=1497396 RepID=A0ABW3MFC3_9PSEU